MGYDAEDKSYCTQCAVHPDALRGLIDSKRNYVGAIPEPDELCERNKGYVEAVKTLCHELEQVIDDEA